MVAHGFFPHWPRFDIPHPYPCENHAPSQFSFHEHSWLGYLIKYAYLHDDKIQYVCHVPRYTIGDHSIRNIAQPIDGGALAFSSAP